MSEALQRKHDDSLYIDEVIIRRRAGEEVKITKRTKNGQVIQINRKKTKGVA